jgi:hypothetical protein
MESAATTLAQAAERIRDDLLAVQNAPHEDFDGHGGLCPICGLTTSLLTRLREELDALALREHAAANPTPPSGPRVHQWPMEEAEPPTPAKTTDFHRKDGSLLMRITVGPIRHFTTRPFPRRGKS